MRRSPWRRAIFCFVLILFGQVGLADDLAIAQAKELFERFQRLERAYDPKVADIYADEARIVSIRKSPFGRPDRKMELSGAQYKAIIRNAMGTARARGDVSTYSEVAYSPEGERVRIECTRYSELKKYSSPYSLLVAPTEQGEWLIFEEYSESKPF